MVLTRSSSFSHAERRRALRTLTERDVSPRPRSARSTAKEDLGRTIRPPVSYTHLTLPTTPYV